MPNKTRKHRKTRSKHLDAKKGAHINCLMKTCRAKKYKAIYGSSGGNIRSNRALFG
jgi:hypothetical protein